MPQAQTVACDRALVCWKLYVWAVCLIETHLQIETATETTKLHCNATASDTDAQSRHRHPHDSTPQTLNPKPSHLKSKSLTGLFLDSRPETLPQASQETWPQASLATLQQASLDCSGEGSKLLLVGLGQELGSGARTMPIQLRAPLLGLPPRVEAPFRISQRRPLRAGHCGKGFYSEADDTKPLHF